MTTAGDIITQSLKKAGVIGIGQAAGAEDSNDALLDLNDMIAQWRRKRWLIWHLVDIAKVSTGAQSYSVGAGGDFNVARPDRLEAAFLRQIVSGGQNVDYPLDLIQSREDYNLISVKGLGSFPVGIFYDAAYPTGRVYPWPVPLASIYEVHITVKETLSSFANLATTVSMPEEFVAAVKWNLAGRLRVSYRLPVDPSIVALAKDSLNVIRNANTQIPRLQMPTELVRPGIYNILSDQYY